MARDFRFFTAALRLRSIILVVCLFLPFRTAADQPGPSISAEGSGEVRQTGIERGYSREEEHESNGPMGSAGLPMQKLPLAVFGMAVVVGLVSWRLVPRKKP